MKNEKLKQLVSQLEESRDRFIKESVETKLIFGSRMILEIADSNIEQLSLSVCHKLNINSTNVKGLEKFNRNTKFQLEEALRA